MSREKGTRIELRKAREWSPVFVRLFSAQLGFTPLKDEIPLGPLESALESRIISA